MSAGIGNAMNPLWPNQRASFKTIKVYEQSNYCYYACPANDANPKAGDANPKAGDTNPKAGDTNPKAGDTNPKASDTNPKASDTNPCGCDRTTAPSG